MLLRNYDHHSFGDYWRMVSYALHISVKRGELCTLLTPAAWVARCTAMAAALDSAGAVQVLADTGQPADQLTGVTVLSAPILRTRLRWHGVASRTIAYQFDGVQFAARKNPPAADVRAFIDWARALNLEPVNVAGASMPALQDQIAALAGARYFLGVNSGFSQLVYSVGCPCYRLVYDYPSYAQDHEQWNGDQCAGVYKDIAEFTGTGP